MSPTNLVLIYQTKEFKTLTFSDKDSMYSSPLTQEFGTATSLLRSEVLNFIYPYTFWPSKFSLSYHYQIVLILVVYTVKFSGLSMLN
jgi:hypothetical protein